MIKEYFFQHLFPNQYSKINRYMKENKSLVMENEHLKRKIDYCLDSVREAIERGNEIIGIETNKNDQLIVVSKSYIPDFTLDINLFGASLDERNPPRIEGKPCINEIFNVNKLEIIDIKIFDNDVNKGNGSIAMEYFIKEALKLKVEKITGELSIQDLDHRDRAIHFYQKFNFNIKNNSLVYHLL